MLQQFKTIVDKGLYPVVPVFNYTNRPTIPWSNKDNWLLTKEDLLKQGEWFIYKNKKGKDRKGKITGSALITGKESGIMVLDLDRNHGDSNKDGVEAYKNIIDSLGLTDEEKHLALDTFTVKTPNGGLHLYFKYKEGLKNSSNEDLAIDIRTDGGIIIMPNSLRNIDNKVLEYEVLKDNPINDIPIKLFNKLIEYFGANKKDNKKDIQVKCNINDMVVVEGGRDNAIIKHLGLLITQPLFRKRSELLKMAHIYNKACLNPPLDDKTIEDKVNSILSYATPPYCNDNGKINIGSLVKYILENNNLYVKGNLLYIYDKESGVYKYYDTSQQKTLYYDHVEVDTDIDHSKADRFAKTIHSLAPKYNNKVLHENRYINCLNGVIDTCNKNKLLEFSPRYMLDTKFKGNYMDYEIYKERYKKSKFKVFLDNILDKDTLTTLQEAWGVMLCPNANKIQQCFIYKGEGSNGKSSLFDIQSSLLDSSAICGISLSRFGDEFIMSMAEGKRLNIVRDDSVEGKINGVFKSVICGEDITVNKKNKDHVLLNFNMAWFFGLNRMPSTEDSSYGFYRRPIIIPFKYRFGTEEQIKNGEADKKAIPGVVEDIINNEMDIVFNWALEGLTRLRNNKWTISQSKASIEEMEEYKKETNTVYAFYKDKLVKSKGERIKSSTLYNSYRDWCINECITGKDIKNNREFAKEIEALGHKKIKASNYYYVDLAYNPFSY